MVSPENANWISDLIDADYGGFTIQGPGFSWPVHQPLAVSSNSRFLFSLTDSIRVPIWSYQLLIHLGGISIVMRVCNLIKGNPNCLRTSWHIRPKNVIFQVFSEEMKVKLWNLKFVIWLAKLLSLWDCLSRLLRKKLRSYCYFLCHLKDSF